MDIVKMLEQKTQQEQEKQRIANIASANAILENEKQRIAAIEQEDRKKSLAELARAEDARDEATEAERILKLKLGITP